MIRAETSVVINRPLGDVWAYADDPSNGVNWQEKLVETTKLSEGPNAVGSQFREVRRAPGQKIESTYELTEYEKQKRVAWSTITGKFPMRGSMSLEAEGDGTRVSFELEAPPGGLFALLQPIMGPMVRGQVKTDFENLKRILESEA